MWCDRQWAEPVHWEASFLSSAMKMKNLLSESQKNEQDSNFTSINDWPGAEWLSIECGNSITRTN